MKQLDIASIVSHLRPWAREHRRLSVGTIRRRMELPKDTAEAVIREMVAQCILHPKPEGESYRVRYPKVTKPERWLRPEGQRYIYADRS